MVDMMLNIRRAIFITLASLLVASCASDPLIVGAIGKAQRSEDITVYFVTRPDCNFQTIAWIQIEGGYFSPGSMINEMREQAAEIGAGGLYVLHTAQSELKDYSGTAKAIRCLSI
ncbi:MAG: hypothetical protein ACI822_001438 [Gammaproteobacteria bacterium]|jgi:hypothetical protein